MSKLRTGALAAALALMPACAMAEGPIAWTGFYVGAHGGHAWNSTEVSAGGMSIDGLSSDGFLGGAHAGFDYQVPGTSLVLGLDGGYTFGKQTFEVTPALLEAEIGDRWFVGGRVGYAIGIVLPYVHGGWTQAETSLKAGGTSVPSGDLKGWRAGAGVEFKVPDMPFMTLGLKYTYTRYDTETVAGITGLERADENHDVMAVINFRPKVDAKTLAP